MTFIGHLLNVKCMLLVAWQMHMWTTDGASTQHCKLAAIFKWNNEIQRHLRFGCVKRVTHLFICQVQMSFNDFQTNQLWHWLHRWLGRSIRLILLQAWWPT